MSPVAGSASPAQTWRLVRRTLARRRRVVASTCAGLAVLFGVTAMSPRGAGTVEVLAAAHELPAGAKLTPLDVKSVALPKSAVPDGALRPRDVVSDLVLSGPVRAGEPLTDVRFTAGTAVPDPGEGLVATPVRIADAGAVRLLRAGDVVDVLAASTSAADAEALVQPADGRATVVADAVSVLAIPHGDGSGLVDQGTMGEGALIVLATTPDQAGLLAQASVNARLIVVMRR